MVKIKNWERKKSPFSDEKFFWKNTKKKTTISVYKTSVGRLSSFWFVGTNNGKILKNFTTRTQALKFARNWMKKHPRG